MRYLPVTAALTLAVLSHAATLNIVDVGAPAIHCVFNTNCTNIAVDSTSAITLTGSLGTGTLHTRVITGEDGSAGDGKYAYLYRIDLSGIQATNPPCTTNLARCTTNRIEVVTNIAMCQTNIIGPSNEVRCETRHFPATNIVFSFTNTIPETNFVRCVTNAAGAPVCFTNFYPGTNLVFTFTNRLVATNLTLCQTNLNTGSNSVVCTTNRVRYHTNVVTCVTNTVACPNTTPCIDTLRLRFGAVTSTLDFDEDGTNDQVFVVTSGGQGAVSPSAASLSNGVVTLQFTPAICAGESSMWVGLVSTKRPGNVQAVVGLTSGSNLVVATRAPSVRQDAISCDLGPLIQSLRGLAISDMVAPHERAAAQRRAALLDTATGALGAAEQGDFEQVLKDIEKLTKRVDGSRGNDWLTAEAAGQIRPLLIELLDCLHEFNRQDTDRDDDDDNDDDDDDNRPHRK